MKTIFFVLIASVASAQESKLKGMVKLSPEEAVKVLTSSHSDRNVTGLIWVTPKETSREPMSLTPWDWPEQHKIAPLAPPFYTRTKIAPIHKVQIIK